MVTVRFFPPELETIWAFIGGMERCDHTKVIFRVTVMFPCPLISNSHAQFKLHRFSGRRVVQVFCRCQYAVRRLAIVFFRCVVLSFSFSFSIIIACFFFSCSLAVLSFSFSMIIAVLSFSFSMILFFFF